MEVPPAVQNGRREQERSNLPARRQAPTSAMPRVSRSGGPVFANAAPAYAADASTLNANTPLASGACSDRRFGRRCSNTSFSTFCTQNPAEEMVNSFQGRSPLGWVIAKNGIPWNSTFLISGVCPSAKIGDDMPHFVRPEPYGAADQKRCNPLPCRVTLLRAFLVLRLRRSRAGRCKLALGTRVREGTRRAYGRVGGRGTAVALL